MVKALSNSLIYFFSTVIKRGIPFLLLPIMTTYLSPAEYGNVSYFLSLSGFLLPFISLNLILEITRIYQQNEETKDSLAAKIFTIIVVSIVTSMLFFIIFILILLIRPVRINNSVFLFLVNPIYTLSVFITSIPITILRNKEKAILYCIVENGTSLFLVLLSLYLVIIAKLGATGRIYSVVFTYAIASIISLIYLFKSGEARVEFHKEYFISLFKRYTPMVFYSLSGIVLSVSDRFYIREMLGDNSLGVYSVAYNFGVLLQIINDSVSKAITPQMYRWGNNLTQDNEKNIVKFNHLYILSFVIIGVILSIILPIIFKLIVNERYHLGSVVVVWVIWGYIFNGFYKNTFIFYVAYDKLWVLSIILSLSAMTNLILNFIFIRMNGIVGAAQATFIAFLISYLLTFLYTSIKFKVRWLFIKR